MLVPVTFTSPLLAHLTVELNDVRAVSGSVPANNVVVVTILEVLSSPTMHVILFTHRNAELALAHLTIAQPLARNSAIDVNTMHAGLLSPHQLNGTTILSQEVLRHNTITLTGFLRDRDTNLVLVLLPVVTNSARHPNVVNTSPLSPHHLMSRTEVLVSVAVLSELFTRRVLIDAA